MLPVLSRLVRAALVAALVIPLPALATAEPVNLKLSFFTSDRSLIYRGLIKPFVDAVNDEGSGLVHVDVFFSGAISSEQNRQPQLVADGTVDLALVVPGRSPQRFYDTTVMELPGLFRDSDEATAMYLRLAENGTLAGYGDFIVIGVYVSDPEDIHSRKPIASLADLKDLRIRVNNQVEADVLQRFGAIPVLLAINRTTEAVSNGSIDGATAPPSVLSAFGIGRVATHHFMIGVGGVPVALLMNRKTFASLPPQAQSIIRKYSGAWLCERSVKQFHVWDREALAALKADPRRTVVFPDAADTKAIHAVYRDVIAAFAASSTHNRELLDRVRAEMAKLRSGG